MVTSLEGEGIVSPVFQTLPVILEGVCSFVFFLPLSYPCYTIEELSGSSGVFDAEA